MISDGVIGIREILAWRKVGSELAPHIERMIAAQGDQVDRDLVRAQHRLAELRNLRAGDKLPDWTPPPS